MAEKKKTAKSGRGRKKKAAEPLSRGLTPAQVGTEKVPAAAREFADLLEEEGARVLSVFRDPLGGKWQVLAALPVEKVEPTPFQRDLSAPHVDRLAKVMEQLDRYLDPIVAVRAGDGTFWTPNGHHRLAALKKLGGRSITALVIPEKDVAYRILALNTERAHNLKERSLEVIRMARDLAELDPRPEREFADQFEEPAFLTLGACYEKKARFAGSAYRPVLRRADAFLGAALPRALETREKRAETLFELDEAVTEAVAALKEKGFESPYLKVFVVARVNPLRFQRGRKASFDETLEKMIRSARRFDPSKVNPAQLARGGGPPEAALEE